MSAAVVIDDDVIDLTDDPDVIPLERRRSEEDTKLCLADLQCKAMGERIRLLERRVSVWRNIAVSLVAVIIVGLSACGVVAAVR